MIESLYREKLVNDNMKEYGSAYRLLSFLDEDESRAALDERDSLLAWLSENAQIGCAGTKVDCTNLSPGCRSCVEGGWSCLFVNGRCNGRCFYCPTSQDDDGPPVTNGILFETPDDYAAYLKRFRFTGASISGGEPLLTPELSISFIKAARERCGNGIHIWLYTNGTMLTPELCRRLKDAGLNEIRFDIGAVRYNLKKLRVAMDIIPVVTVEIPAIPEDEASMRRKIFEMKEAGVRYLNLHQLRLTPHNFSHLLDRGYRFIHGEKITVPDSELVALRLARFSIESGAGLPVNYCSFPYKRRFQHASARIRAALSVHKEGESVTDAGYIRIFSGGSVRYAEAVILQQPSLRFPFEKITLDSGRSLYLEQRQVAPAFELSAKERENLENGEPPERLLSFEKIRHGLAEYF